MENITGMMDKCINQRLFTCLVKIFFIHDRQHDFEHRWRLLTQSCNWDIWWDQREERKNVDSDYINYQLNDYSVVPQAVFAVFRLLWIVSIYSNTQVIKTEVSQDYIPSPTLYVFRIKNILLSTSKLIHSIAYNITIHSSYYSTKPISFSEAVSL